MRSKSESIACHLCHKKIMTSDSVLFLIDFDPFTIYVDICKSCHRENQLNKLDIGER